MSWNIKTPGDYINGPLTVAGSATITGNLTVDTSTLVVDSANNRVGIGTASPLNVCQIQGTGQNTLTPVVTGDGSALSLIDSVTLPNSGGMLVLGSIAANGNFGQVAIKALLTNGSQNGTSDLAVFTRGAFADATLTERFRISQAGICTWSNVGGVAGTAMTLNANGLGIGVNPVTSHNLSSAGPIAISGTNSGTRTSYISNSGSCSIYYTDGGGSGFFADFGNLIIQPRTSAARNVVIATSSAAGTPVERLIVDPNGNVGIGVTPSAWVTYKSISVGGIGACVFGIGTSQVGIAQGAFYNNSPGWAYSSNSQVPTHYLQIDGENRWYTAPSGTAGNTITFTQAMTLDASGNLLVGTTTAGAKITALAGASGQAAIFQQPAQNFWCVLAHNQATSGDNSFVLFGTEASFTSRGSITYNRAAGQVSYNITSDYRLKEDVKPLTGALNRISSLKPSTYKFKETGFTCEGFIAHELAEVIPAAVTGEKDAVNEDGSIKAQGVDLSKVVPILVAAIQELTARVQTLETR